jgi:hypothetical protein
MDPKSSIMLTEKRKHIKNDFMGVLTKNKIPINSVNVDIVEEFTEKILGIDSHKK